MEFKLRKDDGEIPALGSLIRVRLAIAHTAIRMGEPTPGVVASANPKRESSHCIQTKKEPCGAR